MATEQTPEPPNVILQRFFETSESARKAAAHLRSAAEVGVQFADVGDLGILFFQHIVAQDPQRKIGVKLHSGLIKLTMRGWVGVMMSGGGKVIGWLASKGLKGPSAIAHALSRLKKG